MTADPDDWISIGEYSSYQSARIVAGVLDNAEIPHRIVRAAMPLEDRTCWIWVPPESAAEARRALDECAVAADELTMQAMEYPPPDDA